MSFADPFAVAAASPDYAAGSYMVLSRDGVSATRYDPSTGISLKFSHSDPTRQGSADEKHYMQLIHPKDVEVNGVTKRLVASASISLTIPPYGWTADQKLALLNYLLAVLADSDVTAANFVKYGT